MEHYDYMAAMRADLIEYFDLNNINYHVHDYEIDRRVDELSEEVWAEDCITGNGPQGYGSDEECAEYICYNLHDVLDAAYEFDVTLKDMITPHGLTTTQYLDCLYRCYILNSCIYDLLIEFRIEEDDNEDDNE